MEMLGDGGDLGRSGFYYGDAKVRSALDFRQLCQLPLLPPLCHFRRRISTGHTHCTTLPPHNSISLSSALSRSRVFCQQVWASLSGTGLFFLRCQNPTIHSHRVTSHPARKERDGPPKSTNGISNRTTSGISFFLRIPHALWSILQHLACQVVLKPQLFHPGRITTTTYG